MRLLLLVIVLLLADALNAQTHYDMFVEHFDSNSQEFDTSQVYRFWLHPDGRPDSIVRIEYKHEYNVQYIWKDWRRISNAIVPNAFTSAPYPLAQYHTRGFFPAVSYGSRSINGKTELTALTTANFQDSFLIDQRVESLGGKALKFRLDSFAYTEQGEPVAFKQIDVNDGFQNVIGQYQIERFRDQSGKLVAARIYRYSGGVWAARDSQSYEYLQDSLATITYWEIDKTIPTRVSRVDFYGWDHYQSSSHQVGAYTNDITGGDGFRLASYARWNDTIGTYVPTRTVQQTFDNNNRLLSKSIVENAERAFYYGYTYYPNGDFHEFVYGSTPQQLDPEIQEVDSNVYDGDGRLITSVRLELGILLQRYSFVYDDKLGVQAPQMISLGSVNHGKLLELPQSGEHSIIITDMAGRSSVVHPDERTISLANLPSGLYFISIDGGKPRKHLIP